MSNVWTNADGLEVRFNLARTEVTDGGISLPREKVFIYRISDATELGDTDTAAADGDAAFIPAGAIVKDAFFVVDTAFTSGGSATLDLGVKQADGSAIDPNGVDNAIAVASLTEDAVISNDGDLVGTRLANDSYPMATYNTAAFTAGAGTLEKIMATVLHSSLTGADAHEPKGADTATEGQVYIADGAGSGTWTDWPTGWAYYKDDAAAQTFNTTEAKLSIDGAGATTETSYLPREIRSTGDLWDVTNDIITPIAIGDAYDVRLDLPITATSGSPTLVDLLLDIGGGSSSSSVIVEKNIPLNKTAPYTISIGFPIFTLTSFKTNGGQIFLKTDTGSIDITAPSILIKRDHSGVI